MGRCFADVYLLNWSGNFRDIHFKTITKRLGHFFEYRNQYD